MAKFPMCHVWDDPSFSQAIWFSTLVWALGSGLALGLSYITFARARASRRAINCLRLLADATDMRKYVPVFLS